MLAWVERALGVLGFLAAAVLAAPASAQLNDLVSRTAFRVCADPGNLPMSSDTGEGFENRIAELFAENLGRDLQYTWFPMATGFLRRTLLANQCDVVIGYAQGGEMVLGTNPYYTSTHVLITRADSDLVDVTAFDDPRLQGRSIGVIAGSPPASHLARNGLLANTVGYQLMVDRRSQDPNGDMLQDLIDGDLDAAIMWGPIGGPLAKAAAADLVVTPLLGVSEPPRLFYRITMGVRNGEDAWKRELNSMIRDLQPQIDAILRDYGVPLVDEMGDALLAPSAQ